ncbi:MAG: hypothetical protein OHM77_00895 [Candidatus Nitricoxidivorans perseverans]|uniref:Uncharacterized protein n=1 Tax=Candidatus Nitricoxidivorans perseverans TaxID=2975601 RepID=A0AA49IYR3_9PROT|nr:MAG: hypothetical protein OHM77_00895 [Candidatus Nitricoxidivorans perseverans]
MYDVEMQEMSQDFLKCWQAAGMHLNRQVDGGIQAWLRAHPYPPFLEHLSFRLGNQLFFIRVEDVDGKINGPGSLRGLFALAEGANGHACILPMQKQLLGGNWLPVHPGWGIVDAQSRRPIDPVALVTDEKIEMTPWELHDMAVQIVRDHLETQEFQLMSWQGNPEVDPAIWYIGDSKGPEWVVVRSVRYPENHAHRPQNWQLIAADCSRISRIGHFASVAMVSMEQPFSSENEPAIPLWRGYGMHVRFTGVE